MSERLTQYFEVGNYTEKQNIIDVSGKLPLFENGVIMGKAIDRLAEFEDFMEQEEFTSIEDLKAYIKLQSNGSKILIQENQALKERWDILKEYIDKHADNFDEGISSVCSLILDKMQELEDRQ